jgi:hypothetical protein
MSSDIVRIRGIEQFEKQVVASPLPVFVSFIAAAHPGRPSGAIAAILRKLAADVAGKLRLVEIDSEDPANAEIKFRHPQPGVPGFFFEVGGNVVYRFVCAGEYAGFREQFRKGLHAVRIILPFNGTAERQFEAAAARLWQDFLGADVHWPSTQEVATYVAGMEAAVDAYFSAGAAQQHRTEPFHAEPFPTGKVCRIGDPFCR